jgi:lysozyme family protein
MKTSWPIGISFTLRAEGNLSDLRDDPGGSTIMGLSSHYWPKEYKAIKDLLPTSRQAYAEAFYKIHFWTPLDCDDLSYPLDIVVFDSSVNLGPSWARTTLILTQDWNEYLRQREEHYHASAKPEFLKGLLNRCEVLRAMILKEA